VYLSTCVYVCAYVMRTASRIRMKTYGAVISSGVGYELRIGSR